MTATQPRRLAEIAASKSVHRLILAGRGRLAFPAVALALAMLAGASADTVSGQDATWSANPGSGDFNTAANWSPNSVPTGTAFFGASSITSLTFTGNTAIGGWTFNAGAYTFNIASGRSVQFTGDGIVVNGGSAAITNSNVLIFFNSSTAGHAEITNNSSVWLYDDSTAGNATITNNNSLDFYDSSTAGNATITNNNSLEFYGNSTAGSAMITNAVGGYLNFYDNSTAGNATITNGNVLNFYDSSTAGNATITNAVGGYLFFTGSSTAGNAEIINEEVLNFYDDSTAGNATITNNYGLAFNENSTAGNARLINNAGGWVLFHATAGPLGDGQISAGSIEGAGNFQLGTNTLTVGGNGLSTEVSGAISDFGGGSLVKIGTGTLTLSGANIYTGDTTVNAGTLNVAGSLLSSVVVNAGGTLAGIGTVGGLALNSGGILAPGNSIGTITVVGDAAFNSGSVYRVEVAAPNQSDRLSVTGTATINGGAVQVSKLSPEASYQGGQTYRILEAGTLVRNADFSLNQPFLFLDASLGYGTDYVDLLLAAKAAPSGGIFSTVALTPNQSQAAAALGGLAQSGDALAVYNHFLAMTDADRARRAIDLSSGEVHASGWHMFGQSSELFSRTLRHQGLAGVGMGAGPDALVPETDGGDAGLVVDDLHPRPCGTWAAPLGSHGRVGGDGNAARLEWWNAGLAGGFEGLLGDGGAVGGFAFGYLRSEGSVDDRLSRLEADGLHLGTYAAWTDGAWTVNGAFSYAATQLSTERRNVALMGRTAEADYWTHSLDLSGEVSYAIELDERTRLAPLLALRGGWAGHGGFAESGAGALNLVSGSESWERFDTGLGLALTHVLATDRGPLVLEARAVWEHAFADVVPDHALRMSGSPVGFTVRGPDADRNRLRLGLGVSWGLSEDVTLRARYDGLLSDGQQEHGGSVGVSIRY